MEAKPKRPLWMAITLCAINITFGLFYNASTVALFQPIRDWDLVNKYFEGSYAEGLKVPAIVGIILCDFILIVSAMLPKKTIDQSKKSVERNPRPLTFVTTSLVSFKFIFRQIISSNVLHRDVVRFSNLKPKIPCGLKPTHPG